MDGTCRMLSRILLLEAWSEWEYNNFGPSEVAKCLLHNGIELSQTKWFDMIGYEPQMFFWADNGATKNYVIVRTVPAGHADEEYVIRKRVLEDLTDWNGYFVDIKVCSMWNDLDFQDKQIYRIAPVYQPEITFEPIEEAIKNHKNIKLIDD